jgi:hypothetical protein
VEARARAEYRRVSGDQGALAKVYHRTVVDMRVR